MLYLHRTLHFLIVFLIKNIVSKNLKCCRNLISVIQYQIELIKTRYMLVFKPVFNQIAGNFFFLS